MHRWTLAGQLLLASATASVLLGCSCPGGRIEEAEEAEEKKRKERKRRKTDPSITVA
jgi:hypothetical protein